MVLALVSKTARKPELQTDTRPRKNNKKRMVNLGIKYAVLINENKGNWQLDLVNCFNGFCEVIGS